MHRFLLSSAVLATVTAAKHTPGPGSPLPITSHQWRRAADVAVDHAHELKAILLLKTQNAATLESLLWMISDPRSEAYGDRLSHEAVRALLSPGQQALQELTSWLAEHGVGQIRVARHEDQVTITATVAQLEAMFGIHFHVYKNVHTGDVLIRSKESVKIPERVSGIIDFVSGLSDLPLPPQQAKSKQRLSSMQPQVTPEVLYKAYNMTGHMPKPIEGKKNIQSYYQNFETTNLTDMTNFCNKYLGSTPSPCTVTFKNAPNPQGDNDVESNLDSQYIFATSAGAETWSWSFFDLYTFCGSWYVFADEIFKDDVYPFVVSISYGLQINEQQVCTPQEIKRVEDSFQKLGTIGVSIMVASGDSGTSYDGRLGYQGQNLYPSWPASSPWVTAAGATSFEGALYSPQQSVFVEDPSFGWSGGGFAFSQPMPSYQKAAVERYHSQYASKLPPSGAWASPERLGRYSRGTPDVSVLGWGYQVALFGDFYPVAGTSCSSPAFAGMVTQLNWVRMADGGKTLGFLNPFLYQNADAFTDITKGNNDANDNGFGFPATEGWDATTGLGTPNFGKMVAAVRKLNSGEGVVPGWRPPAQEAVKRNLPSARTVDYTMPVRNAQWVTSRDGMFILAWQVGGENLIQLYNLNQKTQVPLQSSSANAAIGCAVGASKFACYAPIDYNMTAYVLWSIDYTGAVSHLSQISSNFSSGFHFHESQFVQTPVTAVKPVLGIYFLAYSGHFDIFTWQLISVDLDTGNVMQQQYFTPNETLGHCYGLGYLLVNEYGGVAVEGSFQNGPLVTFGSGCSMQSSDDNELGASLFVLIADQPLLYDYNTCTFVYRFENMSHGWSAYADGKLIIGMMDGSAAWTLTTLSPSDERASIQQGTLVFSWQTVVDAQIDGLFGNCSTRFFGSSNTNTMLGLIQGKQNIIDGKTGQVTARLGRIAALPTSAELSAQGTIMDYTFDAMIELSGGETLIPNTQGGTIVRSGKVVDSFSLSPMGGVTGCGAGFKFVCYQQLPAGDIVMSAEFSPKPTE